MTSVSNGSGPRLTVEVDQADERAVVRVEGELDLTNAYLLEEAISPLCLDDSKAVLTFDMKELSFIDSSGLAVLLRAASTGILIRIHHASDFLREVIDATGLNDVLRIEP